MIIPFDTYNLFYRNGAIGRIRAGLEGQTYREARQGEEEAPR